MPLDWEGAILTDELYRRRRRFLVPVVLESGDVGQIPKALRRFSYHVVDGEPGYLKLYRMLTDQPATPAPPIGTPKALDPKPRRSTFGLLSSTPTSPEPVETGAVTAYRNWAAERYGHLDLVGLGAGGVRMRLEKIYVPLRILERPEQRVDFEGKRPREEAFAGWTRTLELDRLFLRVGSESRTRHGLIFGEPGSGKTTALKKLHQLVLGRDGEHGGPAALGLAPSTLPVFLRLRRFTPDLLEQGLEAYLEAELRELSGNQLPAGLGAALWQRRRLLLLCDGLDEIADPGHRVKVLERLAWHLADPSVEDVRAVVSCRYGGWPSEVRESWLEAFLRLDVRPFDDPQIARLVELWFREVERRGYVEPAVAADRANGLIRALTDPEHRRQEFLTLVSTPLLLTLLCLVVMRGGEIPRRRVDFYEECLRILVREWRARQVRREPPVSSDRALLLLGDAAWYLHSSRRRADLTFLQALRLFHRRLGDRRLASEVFRWLLEDVALLDRYTERHYGFVHLHIQEHLAARHLAEHPELLDRVCEELEDSWWTEVIQLMAGLPGAKGFAPLLRRLLATDVPLRRAGLLAACLREASDPDLEPFYEVLRGDAEPQLKTAVLSLLRGRREPTLVELAAALAAGGPDSVGDMARQVIEAAKAPEIAARNDVFLLHAPGDRRAADLLAEALGQRTLKVDRPTARERWDDRPAVERMLDCPRVFVLFGADRPQGEDVLDLLAMSEGEAVTVTLPGEPRPVVPGILAELGHYELRSFDDDEVGALVRAVRTATGPAVDSGVGAEAAEPASIKAGKPFTEPLAGEVFLPIAAGRFEMGGTVHSDEQPIHWVRLSDFWLARTPVINRQYRQFLEATGCEEPPFWRDRRFSDPEQPVVGVNWHDAAAYCRWLSEHSPTGYVFELPTEAQWEYAARGTDGREFPWGNEAPDSDRACFGLDFNSGQPAPVGSYAAGTGPFLHLDLAGNVWEWCRDLWESNYERWADKEPVDPIGEANSGGRPLRGGAWWSDASSLRSAFRYWFEPVYRGVFVGFRLSCAPSSTAS